MKKFAWMTAALVLCALPALAADPGFNIEALCKKNNTDKTAIGNCIDEERSVREEVLEMNIPDAVFNQCLAKVKSNPAEANYYGFITCVREATGQ